VSHVHWHRGKQKNLPKAKAAPKVAGDVWTWAALDADSKLIISFLIGGRDGLYAMEFVKDVAGRLHNHSSVFNLGDRRN